MSAFQGGNLAWPTVVFEVSRGTQGPHVIEDKIRDWWFSAASNTQVVFLIRYYSYDAAHGTPMAIYRYERGNAPLDAANRHTAALGISFGDRNLNGATYVPAFLIPIQGVGFFAPVAGPGGAALAPVAYPPCNAAGIPDYQISIPAALHQGVAVPPALAPADVWIDLFPIQQAIVRRQDSW